MPPQGSHTASPWSALQTWTTILALVVAALSLFAGIQLARSNSDVICTAEVKGEGACTGGSWGPWSVASQTTDTQGKTSIVESRTYTGVRDIVTGLITYATVVHVGCSGTLQEDSRSQSGTIVTQQAACQIQETREKTLAAGVTDVKKAVIVSQASNEFTGAVILGSESTSTGTYIDFLDLTSGRLASSTIKAIPSLVRRGEPTHVIWSAERVKSCTVQGTNGDSWSSIASPPEGELSSPLAAQTTYTLTCQTGGKRTISGQAVVNIIPEFEER